MNDDCAAALYVCVRVVYCRRRVSIHAFGPYYVPYMTTVHGAYNLRDKSSLNTHTHTRINIQFLIARGVLYTHTRGAFLNFTLTAGANNIYCTSVRVILQFRIRTTRLLEVHTFRYSVLRGPSRFLKLIFSGLTV